MMTRRTTARADELARVLDGTAPAVTAEPAVAALAAVAASLAALPTGPAPAFRETLRARLMAEAAQVLPQPGTPTAPTAPASPVTPVTPAPAAPLPAAAGAARALPSWLAGPAAQLATGGLAALVAVSGSGVAAARALPGDAFYGVKRTVEQLRLLTADDAVAEGRLLLDQASTRIHEIERLLAGGDVDVSAVFAALRDLDADVDAALRRLVRAAADGHASAYAVLTRFLAYAGRRLAAVQARLPDLLAPEAALVAIRLDVAAAQVGELTRTPAGSPTGAPAPHPASGAPSPHPSVSSTPTSVPTPTASTPTGLPTGPTEPTGLPSPSLPVLPSVRPLPSLPALPAPTLP